MKSWSRFPTWFRRCNCTRLASFDRNSRQYVLATGTLSSSSNSFITSFQHRIDSSHILYPYIFRQTSSSTRLCLQLTKLPYSFPFHHHDAQDHCPSCYRLFQNGDSQDDAPESFFIDNDSLAPFVHGCGLRIFAAVQVSAGTAPADCRREPSHETILSKYSTKIHGDGPSVYRSNDWSLLGKSAGGLLQRQLLRRQHAMKNRTELNY